MGRSEQRFLERWLEALVFRVHMESYGYIYTITINYIHIYILLISSYIYLYVISQLQQTLRSCGSPAGEQKWRVFRCGCIDLPVLGRSDPQRDGKGDELTGLQWFASHVVTNYRYYRLMTIMENERASNSMRRVLKPNNQIFARSNLTHQAAKSRVPKWQLYAMSVCSG